MCSLSSYSFRVFEVFIFKFIKSKASHMFESKLSYEIEENPRPKPSSNQSFSICHWNLNSISSHNYIKVPLLRAYISIHKFDVFSFSEIYLDSDTSDNDDQRRI